MVARSQRSLALTPPGQGKECPRVAPRLGARELGVRLEATSGMFSRTSLQAETPGLAPAPTLVYSLGKKTRSLLIGGGVVVVVVVLVVLLIITLQTICPQFLILASWNTLHINQHALSHSRKRLSIFFFLFL